MIRHPRRLLTQEEVSKYQVLLTKRKEILLKSKEVLSKLKDKTQIIACKRIIKDNINMIRWLEDKLQENDKLYRWRNSIEIVKNMVGIS